MRTLHLLSWSLNDIINNLDQIKYQGFDSIQINPIQPFKHNSKDSWWLSYQPLGFYVGNTYGNKDDLITLCNEARRYNIDIIADVVCNHTAGAEDGSIYPYHEVDEKLKNNPYFWKSFAPIIDWENRHQVTHNSMGLPGLNLENYDLQDIVVSFLNELVDCGVNGFRFDAAKSIALPSENCDFWSRVIYLLKKYGLYIYGEVLFDNEIIKEYSKYIKVLTTSDYYDKNSIVKFVECHDSYYSIGWTKNMSSEEIGYRYRQLSNMYPNTLFFARPYDDEWKKRNVKEGNNVLKMTYK